MLRVVSSDRRLTFVTEFELGNNPKTGFRASTHTNPLPLLAAVRNAPRATSGRILPPVGASRPVEAACQPIDVFEEISRYVLPKRIELVKQAHELQVRLQETEPHASLGDDGRGTQSGWREGRMT